ncbi:hypothetical protein EB796_005577 [Bugula neritina]|uniref:Uncharacterized protein n=1 Tax=Bugula neritina TaxID=10212 RepID=A0A7J7KD61_BUGNE|nr:hypothetical protein EB796_005577 [Bugula neritina]
MLPVTALAIICVAFLQTGSFPEIDYQTLVLIENGGILGNPDEPYCDRKSCDDFVDEALIYQEKERLEKEH